MSVKSNKPLKHRHLSGWGFLYFYQGLQRWITKSLQSYPNNPAPGWHSVPWGVLNEYSPNTKDDLRTLKMIYI